MHEIENILNVCENIKEKNMTNAPNFQFELLVPEAKLPKKANSTDSGWDVYSPFAVTLTPNKPVIVKTGLRCRLPEGFELQVRSRSGLATKGVFVMNSPGTIDTGFRNEIGVILCFVSPDTLNATFEIKPGDRIAQLVPAKVQDVTFSQVDSVSTDTDRGTGGFGSTGR
jgi:dUTP pyrophosphatase